MTKEKTTEDQAKTLSEFNELVEQRIQEMQSILPGFYTVMRWGGFEKTIESKSYNKRRNNHE